MFACYLSSNMCAVAAVLPERRGQSQPCRAQKVLNEAVCDMEGKQEGVYLV